MSIKEADAKPFENSKVLLTLVDGTKIKGYLAGVGYAGLRLMVRGVTSELRFSSIRSIKGR